MAHNQYGGGYGQQVPPQSNGYAYPDPNQAYAQPQQPQQPQQGYGMNQQAAPVSGSTYPPQQPQGSYDQYGTPTPSAYGQPQPVYGGNPAMPPVANAYNNIPAPVSNVYPPPTQQPSSYNTYPPQAQPQPQTSYPPPSQPQPSSQQSNIPPGMQFGGPSVSGMSNQFGQMNMNTSVSQQPQQPQPGFGGPQQSYQQHQPPRPIVPDGVNPLESTFMSLTVNQLPPSKSSRASTKLPFGVVLQPMKDPQVGSIPVVNFGAVGIVRCRKCRAYINPYVVFTDGGAKWECNFCYVHNEVPAAYYCQVDPQTGIRNDIDTRPELTESSVELIATAEYMMRAPMPPTFVFCIDVSYNSVQSGMLSVLVSSIKSFIDDLPGDGRTMVGFITFDSTIHYYKMSPKGGLPQMCVIPDLDDIFIPSPSDLLVNLTDCREQVDALLDGLVSMNRQTTNVESALGPALDAATKIMTEIGGKLLVFLSGLPSIGKARLANREDPRLLGSQQESTLLKPADEFYGKLGVAMTRAQIRFDLFLFADQYMDVATIGQVARYTGGRVYYYPSFHESVMGEKFSEDLKENALSTVAWESVLRVRASAGFKVDNFHGHFFLRGQDLLALPAMDKDAAFAMDLQNLEKTEVRRDRVSIQAACLYTSSNGERLIRVHTTCVPVTSNPATLFEAANASAMMNILAKKALTEAVSNGFHKARETLRMTCVSIIRAYQTAGGYSQNGQLPDGLASLPILCLGLLKHTALRDGTDIRPDERARVLYNMVTMGANQLDLYIRPRLIPLHEMSGEEGLVMDSGYVQLPNELPLSAEYIRSDGAYLIDTGVSFFIRLGSQLATEFLSSAFGVPSLDNVDVSKLSLSAGTDPNGHGARVLNVLTYLRRISSSYQHMYVMREGDPTEVVFFHHMIEDRSMGTMSLQEFVTHMYQAS